MVQPCPSCQGQGKELGARCGSCRGAGQASRAVEIKVQVPAGVEEGQRLRVMGEGDLVQGARGDLYLNVHIAPHSTFTREGSALHCELTLAFHELALGTSATIELLTGKSVTLKVPEGTQAGQVLRLRGKGLPPLDGGQMGDLLVTVGVRVPKALTATERELIVALRSLHERHNEGDEAPREEDATRGPLDGLRRWAIERLGGRA